MASKTTSFSDGQENKTSSSHRSKKIMNVTVSFLDDSTHVFQLQAKNVGQVLLDKVSKFINLLEVDYFGLEYEDEKNTKCWLDALKPLCSQIATSFPTMFFCVKFYTPDPAQLEDEFTRYLFSLQVKKDLVNGFLQCNDNTAAVMISYVIQADFGDFILEKCTDGSYLSNYKFVPFQDVELERKTLENHKKLVGQLPAEADLNLLETARRCELYGIKMTAAKDHEGVPLNLAVAHLGVLVFQNYTKINTFSWAKIRKLSFKRKKFLIKLHPEGYGYYKDTVEFFFEGRNECKTFWKKCIENHTFFRCTDAKHGMRQKPKIFSRGSSFRYSGRTQKQVSEFVRENCFKRQPFQRSTSLRTPSSPSRSISSPQPLLPVTSLSCGSISDISKENIPPQKMLSTSEPSTPHVAPESLNGNATKTPQSGLVSPDEDCNGFQSPDFYAHDTDDNISHDSYQVVDAHKTNSECMPTNNGNLLDSESELPAALLTNGTNDCDGDRKEVALVIQNENRKPLHELENNNNIISETADMNNVDMIEREVLRSYKELYKSSSFDSEGNETPKPREAGSPFQTQVVIEHTANDIVDSPDSNFLDRPSGDEGSEKCMQQTDFDRPLSDKFPLKDAETTSVEDYNPLNDSQQNFGTSTFYISSPYAVRLANKKKSFLDKSYFLAKELLMTERTFRKDLEIVDVVFREEFYKQCNLQSEAVKEMLQIIDPLHEKHCSLLRDLEQRLAFWEGRPVTQTTMAIKGFGDILLSHKEMIQIHSSYLKKLPKVLEMIYRDLTSNQSFARMYTQFEAQKICYLPLASFMIRPVFRLTYYNSLLKDLQECYNDQHVDYANCIEMLKELCSPCENIEKRIYPVVNYAKLMELQHSLSGFSNLVENKREFIREGCLFKITQNGSQQHLFFLFSDIILHAIRVQEGKLHFKVQGQLSILNLKVEETEPKHGMNHCLTLCSGEQSVTVGAPSEKEYLKWVKDLRQSVQEANKDSVKPSSQLSTTPLDEKYELNDEIDQLRREEKQDYHPVNTTMHICWHRNISVSHDDLFLSMKHNISGYLLRKFKNSSGWQKVWVVLANFCLFFYRSYLDESPLASLPLAGYRMMHTSKGDLVYGELIFKLVFKNHEYFFTVENKHTFERWMKAISVCTLVDDENTKL